MKVDAIQHKEVTVEINDDEIYRIAKQAILDAYYPPKKSPLSMVKFVK